jgi:hypothetical protein
MICNIPPHVFHQFYVSGVVSSLNSLPENDKWYQMSILFMVCIETINMLEKNVNANGVDYH